MNHKIQSILGCEYDDRLPCPEEMDKNLKASFDLDEEANADLAYLKAEWQAGRF